VNLLKQGLAVKKQVIAVQEENHVNGFVWQIGVTVFCEYARQRDVGRKRRSLIFLRSPFLQDNVQLFAFGLFENRRN